MRNVQRTPSFNEMVDAMANVQRRKLLVALLDHNPQDDSPVVVVDSDGETDALNRLLEMNHVHLPKLEAYGFIDWDKDRHQVMKGENFDEIRPLLELLKNHETELPADWL